MSPARRVLLWGHRVRWKLRLQGHSPRRVTTPRIPPGWPGRREGMSVSFEFGPEKPNNGGRNPVPPSRSHEIPPLLDLPRGRQWAVASDGAGAKREGPG